MFLSFNPYIKKNTNKPNPNKLFQIKVIANAGLHRNFIPPPGSKLGEVHLGQPDNWEFTFIVPMSPSGLWSIHTGTSIDPHSRNNLFYICFSQKSIFMFGENKSYFGEW